MEIELLRHSETSANNIFYGVVEGELVKASIPKEIDAFREVTRDGKTAPLYVFDLKDAYERNYTSSNKETVSGNHYEI